VWVTDWTVRAACKGTDPDELFVQGAAQNRAKLICRGCPVRTECLADALDTGIVFGVWGGMTERERHALLRRRPEVTSWRDLLERARDHYELQGLGALSIKAVADFEACYKAEFNRLVIFLLRQGIPHHDAMDAAQTAFTEALRQWEHIWAPRAWLRRVAIRSVKHLPEFPVEDVSMRDQPLLPDGIEVKEQTRHVLKALAKLPPQQRTVMAWTLDGFSPAEIAAEVGCTPEAARQNLHRARETLKRILQEEQEEGR
jgi:WhiB family transcriptional regulator, redox-sensing transcriptional regulator